MNVFTANGVAYCASEYRDFKSANDLFCNKALKASFFAWIVFLTSCSTKNFFLIPTAIFNHFCPKLSTANEIIAVWNNDHSVSMSLETQRSSRNFDTIFHANYFLTSLPTKDSHLNLLAILDLRNFLFGQGIGIRICKHQNDNQVTILPLIVSFGHSKFPKTNLTKLCNSLSKTFAHTKTEAC